MPESDWKNKTSLKAHLISVQLTGYAGLNTKYSSTTSD